VAVLLCLLKVKNDAKYMYFLGEKQGVDKVFKKKFFFLTKLRL